MVKSRWNSNKILSILNDNGDLVHGQEAVELVAVSYFKDMFCPPIMVLGILAPYYLLDKLAPIKLSPYLPQSLMRRF